MPMAAVSLTIARISSKVRICDMGTLRIPSGMQYLQRRLHLSVTEIRR